MATPRCLILCKSVHHENTARVAEIIASVLGADVLSPEEMPHASLKNYQLVGFGSGVYYGRMHESLFTGSLGCLMPRNPQGQLSSSRRHGCDFSGNSSTHS